MSRSDLDEIQKQLKVAIQNHQMLMAQMKNNPQDSSLQRRIHTTQREISSLGEKQKGIFQLLRKSSGNPPNGTPQDHTTRNVKPSPLPAHRPLLPAHMPVAVTTTPAGAHTTPVSAHTKFIVSAHTTPVGAHTVPISAHTNLTAAHATPVSAALAKSLLAHGSKALAKTALSMPNTLTIPFQGNSITAKSNIVLPANLNSLALALGPNATLTLPMSSGGSLTLPASALPPHLLKPGTRLTLPMAGRNIPLVPVRPKIGNSNNSPVQSSSRPSTSSPAPSSPSNQRSGSSSMTSSQLLSMTSPSRTNQHAAMEVPKPVDPSEMKQDFMASLDLVSPERMKELANKRSERKRRTTANPNFSYGNNYLSERKYGLNNYLSAMQARRHHRHRGESPLPHSHPPSPCSANGVQGHNNLHNGQSMDVHDDYCAVCRRSGQLLMCDTCSLVYHLHCLSPPLTQIPTGTWRCPKCEVEFKKRRTSSPVSIPDNNNSPQKPLSDNQCKSLLRQSLTTTAYSRVAAAPTLVAVAPTTLAMPQTVAAVAAPPPTLAAVMTAPSTLVAAAAATLVVPKPALTVPRLTLSPVRAGSPGKAASPVDSLSQRPAPSLPRNSPLPKSVSETVPDDVANENEEAPMVIDEGENSEDDLPVKDSVAILRAVKEEEKRKLLTQHQNLQSVNAQLQQKAQQLSQSIDAQIQTKAELAQSVETAQQSIDAIHQFIEVFKT